MSDRIEIYMEFFAVKSYDGKYFHNVGYSHYGKTWVDDLSKAKIYGKIGQARARVTWFSQHHPEYPMPVIVKIIANEAIILNEEERVKNAILKKEEKRLIREKHFADAALKNAEREFKIAKDKLEKLKGQ